MFFHKNVAPREQKPDVFGKLSKNKILKKKLFINTFRAEPGNRE